MAKSKVFRASDAKIDRDRFYSPTEAVVLAKETGSKRFDSTVEVALKLSVDPRKADQMVRGTVMLPHGTGKTARVIVFANGPAAEAAIAAGADEVGSTDLIERVAGGWTDFDAQKDVPQLDQHEEDDDERGDRSGTGELEEGEAPQSPFPGIFDEQESPARKLSLSSL